MIAALVAVFLVGVIVGFLIQLARVELRERRRRAYEQRMRALESAILVALLAAWWYL